MTDTQKEYALDQFDKRVKIIDIARQINVNREAVRSFIRKNRPKLPDPEKYDYKSDHSGKLLGTWSFTEKSAEYAYMLYLKGYSIRQICNAMNVGNSAMIHLKNVMRFEPHPEAEPFEEWIRKQG